VNHLTSAIQAASPKNSTYVVILQHQSFAVFSLVAQRKAIVEHKLITKKLIKPIIAQKIFKL
jgi:hypothetical protein